jgi:hypothetical protein
MSMFLTLWAKVFYSNYSGSEALLSHGGSFPCSRRSVAKLSQRRHPCLFPPRLWQFGGASLASRHFL